MFFRFIFYSILFYFIISIIRKIKIYLNTPSKNHDVNTNYKRNDFRKAEKRDVVEADFEEIKEKK
ncbi:MAG: hypothetical protein Fur0015_02820 [Ignavibacteriales bacterium]